MNNTQIEFVKNALRRESHRWGPIWRTKKKARRKYKGPKKRQLYEYECNICKKYFPSGKVQVDHIIPVGSFKTPSDLIRYVERLLCAESGLQVLCTVCHQQKTNDDSNKKR